MKIRTRVKLMWAGRGPKWSPLDRVLYVVAVTLWLGVLLALGVSCEPSLYQSNQPFQTCAQQPSTCGTPEPTDGNSLPTTVDYNAR